MTFGKSNYFLLYAIICFTFLVVDRGQAETLEPQIQIAHAYAANADWQVHVQVFKPEGSGPFPLIVFSHGRDATLQERHDLKYPVLHGHVAYWLRKGFAVIAPIRPGYGETGGDDIEWSGITISKSGQCQGPYDFRKAVRNAADVVEGVVKWAQRQSWVDRKKIILVGQSVGGLITVAVGARNHPGVIAYINFSGGQGGNKINTPGRSCFPEALTDLFQEFGKTTHIPNLWLYAMNDLYWGPDEPVQWHNAFKKSGGVGQFIQTPPVPDADGHSLLAKGGKLWGVHVDALVSSLGF